jgi:hypothetical protein
MLLFILQMLLLLILLWVINVSKYFNGNKADNTPTPSDSDDWQYLVLVTKFICSIILHVTL